MQIEFSHQSVSQRLSKKLEEWYSVKPQVTHLEETSTILVNDLLFTVSRCRQFDKTNGQYSLTHNGKLIEYNKMNSLVNQS